MTRTALVSRYAAFAVLATLANLATQRVVLRIGEGPVIFAAAVLGGTLVGLVLKYALDKKWIFDDRATGVSAHGKKFSLYTLMGVVTTVIFWGTETIFWVVWHTDFARETGAVLGLAVGYMVKYRLDRRFVFTDSVLRVA